MRPVDPSTIPWDERVRIFLAERLFSATCGATLGDWLNLLWRHRGAIDPQYWPRALLLTAGNCLNSVLAWRESTLYDREIAAVDIRPPLFILGHWRSGTTHLYNLLAQDPRFAYPNVYQVLYPHTFLTTERYFPIALGALFPRTRLIDNVHANFETPEEDELARCNATFLSPYMGWVFPRCQDHYDRYLTLREAPDEEVAAWKAAFRHFLKKLTWRYDRPLLLKSPPHTCRIRLLLEMFPEARFVHVHRNPYVVFQSTRSLVRTMPRMMGLQRPGTQDVDAWIIRRYRTMYDVFFEERRLIPDGRFHEVSFEELEMNPIREVRRIYERLNLPRFDAVQPALQRYVSSISDYRRSEHPELPASKRHEIAEAWRRSFGEWQYACD